MPATHSPSSEPVANVAAGRRVLVIGLNAAPAKTIRNLDWVTPSTDLTAISTDEALLLADAQTLGGLLLAGEIPAAPVIGELIPRQQHTIIVR